ncbi:hypothetical protein [Endozoicomonas sp. YOMI1]|uniref:hypothetical protein n=1 Tax=Endozoicomonas sp. YOMI1 TaxID=2828739 RepID=UPI0021472954|nr:hypothetical protein [Endozoicomonas sp. YOMI1]
MREIGITKECVKEYRQLITEFFCSDGQLNERDFLVLMEIHGAMKGQQQGDAINQSEFTTEMIGLGKSPEPEDLIDLFCRLQSRELISTVYNKTITDDMRESVKSTVMKGTVDRLTKAVWQAEHQKKCSILEGRHHPGTESTAHLLSGVFSSESEIFILNFSQSSLRALFSDSLLVHGFNAIDGLLH